MVLLFDPFYKFQSLKEVFNHHQISYLLISLFNLWNLDFQANIPEIEYFEIMGDQHFHVSKPYGAF